MSLVAPGLIVASFEETYSSSLMAECTHVLNVAEECVVAERVGRAYAKHAIADDCDDADIAAVLGPCVRFIGEAHDAGGVVAVHCLEGKSRSVCAAAAYLCARGSATADEAFERIRAARPCVDVFPKYEADTRRWVAALAAGAAAPA